MPKIIGQAVALQRAYYPTESGHCYVVEPGDTFDLVEGHTDGNWFTRVDPLPAKGGKGKGKGKSDKEPETFPDAAVGGVAPEPEPEAEPEAAPADDMA